MARKLHEHLGAQSQVFTQAEKVRKELGNTFEKKRHLFGESLVQYTPDGEGEQPRTESQSMLQSTIGSELKWLSNILVKAYDSEATIDEGNMTSRGDVVLDNGTKLLEGIPATQ